jgi:hypothetical protein
MQMSHPRRRDELRRAPRERAGLDVVSLRSASRGESGTVYRATDRAGSVTVVKVMLETAPDGYLWNVAAA